MANNTKKDYTPNVSFEYPDWALPYVLDAVQGTNVTPEILLSLLKHESGFDPNAVSPVGAQGIAQFMPQTAQDYRVDPWDITSSINGAAQYLNKYYQIYKNWPQTLAAYNAGPGNVDSGAWVNFPETQNYVKNILGSIGNTGIGQTYAAQSVAPAVRTTPSVVPGVTTTPSTGGRSYTVKPGDTLSAIAQKVYGNANQYGKLSGYRSGNPNLIYPGEKIYY